MAIATEHTPKARRRLAWLRPIKLPPPVNPALVKEAEERADEFGNRLSDAITRFAGSMTFVYLHVIWFAAWIGLGIESYPYGLLTMIVSLEAIFLSTFVMVSQNRQAERSEVRAQLDFETNLRSEIWSVHIGQALGIDADHVEHVVSEAIEGYRRETLSAGGH